MASLIITGLHGLFNRATNKDKLPCIVAHCFILEKSQHSVGHHNLVELGFLLIREVNIWNPYFLHIVGVKVDVIKVINMGFVQQTMVLPLQMYD